MRRLPATCLAMLLLVAAPAQAQESFGQHLADTTTFGAVAVLAPLCNLRDEAWSADLRRAARQRASGGQATDDATLNAQPGTGSLSAALGYGEMEALEDFVADTPEATCKSLSGNQALAEADAAVAEFRKLRAGRPVGMTNGVAAAPS